MPAAPTPAANEPRVIKKYANRRLYDTQLSAYVTLADVRQLVMQRSPFIVRDAKTGEDLTRGILLQIVLEEEAGGEPMFSQALLANLIRFYGHAMQGVMGAYLEKSIEAMVDVQARMAEQAQNLSPEHWHQLMRVQSPLMQGFMGSYLEQSKTMFLQMQEHMQKQAGQMFDAFGLRKPEKTKPPTHE